MHKTRQGEPDAARTVLHWASRCPLVGSQYVRQRLWPSPPLEGATPLVSTASGGAAVRQRLEPGVVPKRVPVLYVGGMPRSGSTLLDLMLGQLPGHCEVGELFYLWDSGPVRDELCACGQRFSACPFWTEVGEVGFGGWDRVDVPEVLRLRQSVDRTACLPFILAPWLWPAFHRRLDRYTNVLTQLYDAVREVSGADVVVDSTKRPSLAYILRRAPGIELRLVQVVRDPRGVVYSWSRQVPLPEGAGPRPYLRQRSALLISRRWLTVNAMIGSLAALGVPRVLLRYEDLMRNPREELSRVAALHNSPGSDPETLTFLTERGLELASSHAVAGGRVRFKTGVLALRLDEAWRRALPGRKRQLVEAVTWPLRWRYGYR